MTDDTRQPLPLATGTGRVLVADDDHQNRGLFSAVLEAEGYCVLQAEDGAAALEQAWSENPDVILLDVTMPKLNGFEVCQRLRHDVRTAHLPVLIITGHSSQSDRLAGIRAGANDFLTKPVDFNELRLRVRNAMYQQHLYKELQARYQELKDMAELHECLTSIIEADTKTLSAMMSEPKQPGPAANGNGTKGAEHGAC